jgi:GxxExxY protein
MAHPHLLHEELTYDVIGGFFEVYNTFGFGFLEPVYMNALELELIWRGHRVAREVLVTVTYKGVNVGRQRLDLVVDDILVVEGKSSYKLPDRATRQLYNYLKATNIDLGLLLHFGPEPQFFRVTPPTSHRPPTPNRDEAIPTIVSSPSSVPPLLDAELSGGGRSASRRNEHG